MDSVGRHGTVAKGGVRYVVLSVLGGALWGASVILGAGTAALGKEAESCTIRVELELETGGSISGLVVDNTSHGIVIVDRSIPYVFAWRDVDFRTAYVAKRDLLTHERGGRQHLTAADHFELGLFSLTRQRRDLAAREFGEAASLDAGYSAKARAAFDEYRATRREPAESSGPFDDGSPPANLDAELPVFPATESGDPANPGGRILDLVPTTEFMHERASEVYKLFDSEVASVIGKGITRLETDHFLIWTDWEQAQQNRLGDWAEAAYRALCEQFGLGPDEQVFLAKCPMFCWRSERRFRKFAQYFDAIPGKNMVGYTRSIEKNGHVHVVLLRRGRSEADVDRFAATLVHESTHAFLHRLVSTRLLPNWVNEGYADMMAARVLGDRCSNRENAALLARQYVRYGWPIGGLLSSDGPIAIQEYPLAHSVVSYLATLGAERLSGFIRSLKKGRDVADALTENYDGLTLEQLEANWRAAVAADDPGTTAARANAEFSGIVAGHKDANGDGRTLR